MVSTNPGPGLPHNSGVGFCRGRKTSIPNLNINIDTNSATLQNVVYTSFSNATYERAADYKNSLKSAEVIPKLFRYEMYKYTFKSKQPKIPKYARQDGGWLDGAVELGSGPKEFHPRDLVLPASNLVGRASNLFLKGKAWSVES